MFYGRALAPESKHIMLYCQKHPRQRWAVFVPGVLLLLWLSAPGAAAQVPVYDYQIIKQYPHNTRFFTQGLLVHEGRLFEGTGQYGQSMLMELNLEDGAVVRSRALPDRYFGEGIAVVGERIFQLTWRENIAFEFDLETFEPLNSHFVPTEGWGLSYDGQSLILSDGSHQLFFLDPETFRSHQVLPVTLGGQPLRNLNELEYIDGEIWANVWMTEQIVRIHPVSGEVVGIIDLSGLRAQSAAVGNDSVLNGIAWDAQARRLYVTGKLWAYLYEIELVLRQ
jgi:glutaminyl-peptide cyclotransferase